MELVDIAQTGLRPADLEILYADTQPARILMFQCLSDVDFREAGYVRNVDRQAPSVKHQGFLSFARERCAAMAATPEYSTPWSVVEALTGSIDLQPNIGSLWVLGCESTTPEELDELSERTRESIRWYYKHPPRSRNQVFYSAVVYVFHLEDSTEAEPRLGALVQFKGHEMGGVDLERDSLIRGSEQYIIHNVNHPDSIRLLTFICADVFNFRLESMERYHPYLLLHLQLNLNPYNEGIIRYRSEIYRSSRRNDVEILSLNWAAGSQIQNSSIEEHNGTAYYLQPPDKMGPSINRRRILDNHGNGIHLRFSRPQRFSVYLFNSNIEVFEVDATKVSMEGPAQHQRRDGITSSNSFSWNDETYTWEALESVDDGICDDFHEMSHHGQIDALHREWLICLSTGCITEEDAKRAAPKELPPRMKEQKGYLCHYWSEPRALQSFYLEADHTPKGTLARIDSNQRFGIGESLAKVGGVIPNLIDKCNEIEVVEDFIGGAPSLGLCKDELAYREITVNVIDPDTGQKATVVNVGPQSPENAKNIFDRIKIVINPKRLIVFYTHLGECNYYADEIAQIIDGPEGPNDFNRGR